MAFHSLRVRSAPEIGPEYDREGPRAVSGRLAHLEVTAVVRPHVELVYQQDLIWHADDLGSAGDQAEIRRLSSDEESGAGTVLARFGTSWSRPGGYHQGDTEWFVLSGLVTVGDAALGPGGYVRAPAGKATPPMTAAPGSQALIFCDNGQSAFVASAGDWAEFVRRSRLDISGLPGELTISSTSGLGWEPAPWEAADHSADHSADRSADRNGPASRIKVLYRQPPLTTATSAEPVTALWEAPPGWADRGFHHRGVFAEAYGLSGVIEYSHGRLSEGGYLYRPPRIQTSAAHVAGDTPAQLLVRLGDTAVPWHTSDPYVRVSGHAVNYDPSTALENLVPSGLSVTSRSVKTWVAQYHPRAEPGAPSPSGRFVNAIATP